MNRRAQVLGPLLWNTIGLILVIVFVVGIAILLVRVVGSGSENERAATEFSFLSMAQVIRTYSNSPEPFLPLSDQRDFPVNHIQFIDEDFIMVGFNKGDPLSLDACGTELIDKPVECGEHACLCLFAQTYGKDDFSSEGEDATPAINCATFPNVQTIQSIRYSTAPKRMIYSPTRAFKDHQDVQITDKIIDNFVGGCAFPWDEYVDIFEGLPALSWEDGVELCDNNLLDSYSDFVLYGQCGAFGAEHGDDLIYIEKATINGRQHILISAPISSALRERRQAAVEKGGLEQRFIAAKKLYDERKYDESITALKNFVDSAANVDFLQDDVKQANALIAEACKNIPDTRPECPVET